MKWNNLVIPHQRQSSPIGRTRAGFVAHDHDRNRWCIQHQSCLHNTHNVTHTLTAVRANNTNSPASTAFFRNHHLTIVLLQRIIINVLTPHLEDVHERRHTRSIPFALPPYRLHNLQLGIQRALLEAYSPYHHVAEEIPLGRHKASPTGHRDSTSVSTNSRIPWHQHSPRISCTGTDKLHLYSASTYPETDSQFLFSGTN